MKIKLICEYTTDYSDERLKEIARDSKDYPGGITVLLEDNLLENRDECEWTIVNLEQEVQRIREYIRTLQ